MFTVILMTPERGFAFLQYGSPMEAESKFTECQRAMPFGCCGLFLYDPFGKLIRKEVA